ncbi:hypothetical protein BHYA_0006g00090 [Botrytis hyacinthi]|uniref:Uncharacterized protein n=1 Tax=Botrytis hyacinthi TaxID=278943 RepID=A0A4Z1H2L6_9HELO|nr:hypothetical protein BHYA_0006g00090 [Botrytis hyacinthi]
MSADDATQQQRMRRDDTLASIQVAQAQRVVFGDVSTVEDVHLVLVLTRGDPMSAKRIHTLTQNQVVSSSASSISTPREQLGKSTAEFLRHHGAGHTL